MLLILTLRRSGSIDRDELMELILRQAEKQDATTMFTKDAVARDPRALFVDTHAPARARILDGQRRLMTHLAGSGNPRRALGAPSDRVMALSCPSIHPSVNVTVFTSPSVDRGALHPRLAAEPGVPPRPGTAQHAALCAEEARDGGAAAARERAASRARAHSRAVSGD